MISTKSLSLTAVGAVIFALGSTGIAPAQAATLVNVSLNDGSTHTITAPGGYNFTTPNTFVGVSVTTLSAPSAPTPNTPVNPVPEPSPLWGTLAFGVLGAGWMLKRQPKRSARKQLA